MLITSAVLVSSTALAQDVSGRIHVRLQAPPVYRAAALLPVRRSPMPPDSPAQRLIESSQVRIIAHRGLSSRAPENTLPAFELALECGADLVELDYFHSADHVPVVFHDKTLDRTTDAIRRLNRKDIKIGELSFAELRELDAGAWFHGRFANTRIPSLEESIRLIQTKSVTLIEHKRGDAQTCVELLKRMGVVNDVIVQSFDWEYLSECRKLSPELVLVALSDKDPTDQRFRQATAFQAAGVGWKHSLLDQDSITRAHQMGLKVWAYTVNDTPRAVQLVNAGLDGLITDRPAAMRKLIDQHDDTRDPRPE